MFQTNKTPQEIPFQYIETDYANTGYCCKLDGSGTYTSNKTKRECFNAGGYWTTDITKCPRQVKKNCCSYASAASSGVFTANLTKCQCAALATRTKWGQDEGATNPCPVWSSLIGSGGACCHWYLDGENYINSCEYTDGIEECAALHDGKAEGLKYAFYLGQNCIINGGDIVCNPTFKNKEIESSSGCIDDTANECGSQENTLGNCCECLNATQVSCSITTKNKCKGFWNYFGYLKSCSGSSLCTGVYFHDYDGDKAIPPTASYSTLVSSTNVLEKLPSSKEMYQGGLYVGVFEPGVSTVLGNANTGTAQTYKSVKNKNGTGVKRWVLILAPEDITVNMLKMYNKNTSNYDGFYNMNKTNIPNITGININGFKDWYIPSKQELEFIFNNIPKNYETVGFKPLLQKYYLTSTFFDIPLQNKNFIYAQSNLSQNYGNIFITSELQNLNNVTLRLVRRIELGN